MFNKHIFLKFLIYLLSKSIGNIQKIVITYFITTDNFLQRCEGCQSTKAPWSTYCTSLGRGQWAWVMFLWWRIVTRYIIQVRSWEIHCKNFARGILSQPTHVLSGKYSFSVLDFITYFNYGWRRYSYYFKNSNNWRKWSRQVQVRNCISSLVRKIWRLFLSLGIPYFIRYDQTPIADSSPIVNLLEWLGCSSIKGSIGEQ